MNNPSYQAVIFKMATVLAVLLMLFITTAQSSSYQIQDEVSQTDSGVMIDIRDMVRSCIRQNETYNPQIRSFIFNFWVASCYETADITDYPQLFNSILSSMRRCLHPCNQVLHYELPDIPCTGQAYPNTMSINYDCNMGWQVPLVVESTTTARPPPTTTTRITTPGVQETTVTETTRSQISTILRRTQSRWESTSSRTTTSVRMTTVTDPTEQQSTAATDPTEQQSTAATDPTEPQSTADVTTVTGAITTTTDEHLLIAEERAEYDGYLSADLDTVVCDDIKQLHVTSLEAEIDQNHQCPPTVSESTVEDQLHANSDRILQPNCSTDSSERVHKLTIHYECTGDNSSQAAHAGAEDRSVTPQTNIGLILGIVIPIIVLMIVLISIATIVIYRRRNKIKVLLSSRSITYDQDEGIYQDPNHAFNYSQMNSAYSNENLDDNALYQDPALIMRCPPTSDSKQKNNKTSVESMDSDYQDPNSLPCTGPPGTPSPIRDALYSTHEDPSSLSDEYAEPDVKLDSGDQNIYDMPCMVVTRSRNHSEEYPDEHDPDNRLSQPPYTHMIVTDGQMEPHNYAIIRKSRPITESQYYDLQNEVQLYDSPVYNSTEDVNDISDDEGTRNDEVF